MATHPQKLLLGYVTQLRCRPALYFTHTSTFRQTCITSSMQKDKQFREKVVLLRYHNNPQEADKAVVLK